MDVIHIKEALRWDKIVKSFPNHDVYYLSGYLKAFELHGDGVPLLLYDQSNDNEAICVIMLRDIADDRRFKGKISSAKYFDAITPYGYGGFIFKYEPSEDYLNHLEKVFKTTLSKLNIISVFFRFHPVLNNARFHRYIVDVIDLGKTIAMDLKSPDVIWSNITSKNRNMIRKAEKAGVEIHHSHNANLLPEQFMPIYNATMAYDNAEDYYYFEPLFYRSIEEDLCENYEVFYAQCEGNIIAMSIMIFANGYLNYHLSGSKYEYRNLAPSNLLLYQAALWGYENGMSTLHLGGGVGSGEDSLYKFKAAFNRNSDYQFSIGKMTVDPDKYQYLTSLRADDENFNKESKFFPLYRS